MATCARVSKVAKYVKLEKLAFWYVFASILKVGCVIDYTNCGEPRETFSEHCRLCRQPGTKLAEEVGTLCEATAG